MTPSNWLRRGALSAALAAACAAPAAHALRLEPATGVGAEYSSNVLRAERNEQDETTGIVWGGLSLREDAANLSAEVAGVVESRHYINDVADDDILLSLASRVDWMVLPQRLNWHFEDYFQQTAVNPVETISPSNRQDSNVLWTGPDLFLRLAKLYSLQLSGRYGDFYYEDTNADNRRLAVFARANRRLSPDSEIYLHAERSRTDYDHAGAADVTGVPLVDFDRTDAYAGYQWESVLTELRLEGGYSTIEREGRDDVREPLGRLHIRRRLPAEGGVGLRLSTQLTEGGAALLASGGGRLDIGPDAAAVTHDIAREHQAELFYYGRWGGGRLDARTRWSDEDYEQADLDRRLARLALTYDYPVSPLWMATLFGRYADVDYRAGRHDRRAVIGVGATHRLSRRMTLDVELHDEWQQSNALGRDFNEAVALIELRYGDRPDWAAR